MNSQKFVRRVSDRTSVILYAIFIPMFILLLFDLVSGWLYVLCIVFQVIIVVADAMWLYYCLPKCPDAPQQSRFDYVVICIESIFCITISVVGIINKNLFPSWITEVIWGWLIIVLAYFALTPPKRN